MAEEDKLDPNPNLAPANENGPAAAEKPSLEPLVVELRDKYLRAVAETENIRKRAERDVAEARAYGIAAFAREVLAVADNLTRAIESLDPEARAVADGTFKALLDGVELTRRELHKILEKHGVRRLDGPAGLSHDVLHDREPESGPARRPGLVCPIEALEEPGKLRFLDTDSVIAPYERDDALAATLDDQCERRSGTRVANRVLGQVTGDDAKHPGPDPKLD